MAKEIRRVRPTPKPGMNCKRPRDFAAARMANLIHTYIHIVNVWFFVCSFFGWFVKARTEGVVEIF